VVCGAEAPGAALAAALAMAGALREGAPGDAQVLGPAPLFRLRGRERAQVVVKAGDRSAAIALVRGVVDRLAGDRTHKGVSLSVDVDPQ
jgi:primosomal protein N' (replication factor Y)